MVHKECKNHYDFLRELISNSYDAMASTIHLFPLYLTNDSAQPLCSVLAIFDDGVGMDYLPRTTVENAGLRSPPCSSIDAYLQLGYSTNTGERSIGRFCCGAKQALNKADAGFLLLTRTERMPPDRLLLISEDNIEHKLVVEGGVDWRVVGREEAVAAVAERFRTLHRPSDTASTVARLGERVRTLAHGTIQVIFSRTAPFHERKLCNLNGQQRTWKVPSKPSRIFKEDIEHSTMCVVIRFDTRHGNVLHDAHGQFRDLSARVRNAFGEDFGPKLLHQAELRVFTREHEEGFVVPYGYPRPREEQREPSDPATIRGKVHSDWTGCWARLGPGTFTDDVGRVFAVLWDQNSYYNLRTDFEPLSRRGWKRADCNGLSHVASGFRVQACGVGVCELPAFVVKSLPVSPASNLTESERSGFIAFVQAGERGGAVCTIEGNFNVEPNRSALSQEELSGLRNNEKFLLGLANVLHGFLKIAGNAHSRMMGHLISCHRQSQRALEEGDIEKEAKKRRDALEGSTRLFFRATEATPAWLRAMCMLHFLPADDHRHELQLQHLVSTLHTYALHAASLVDASRPGVEATTHARALHAWRTYLRPGMHFSSGVDVISLQRAHERGELGDPLIVGGVLVERTFNVEYKWSLSTEYNHPLINTDVIIVWDDEGIEPDRTTLQDSQGCDGLVQHWPLVEGFGYGIRRVRDNSMGYLCARDDAASHHGVLIIVLRKLIQCTFEPYCDVGFYASKVSPPEERTKRGKRVRQKA